MIQTYHVVDKQTLYDCGMIRYGIYHSSFIYEDRFATNWQQVLQALIFINVWELSIYSHFHIIYPLAPSSQPLFQYHISNLSSLHHTPNIIYILGPS